MNYEGIEYFGGNDGWPFLACTYVGWLGFGGRDPASVFAVGGEGTVIRYDGSRWSGQDYPLPRADDYPRGDVGAQHADAACELALGWITQHLAVGADRERELLGLWCKARDERLYIAVGCGVEELMGNAVAGEKAAQARDVRG